MTDVLKIALERRNKLHDEIRKLDEFIRMAEALMRVDGTAPAPEAMPEVPAAAAAAAAVAPMASEGDESPMRAAARKLSDADVRRAPAQDAAGADAPRPSIIRRGLAG